MLRRAIEHISHLPHHPFKLARALITTNGTMSATQWQGSGPQSTEELTAWTARFPILHADDEIGALTLVRIMLERAGLHMLSVKDADSVLRIIRHLPVSLLISDIMMPGIDGIELCLRLQDDPATAHIPIFFLNPRGDLGTIQRAFEAGAVAYGVTPLLHLDLMRMVPKLLLRYGCWQLPPDYDPELSAEVIQTTGATTVPTGTQQPCHIERYGITLYPARGVGPGPFRIPPPSVGDPSQTFYTRDAWFAGDNA